MTMVKGPFTLKCVIMQCYIRRKAQITLIVGTTIKCLASVNLAQYTQKTPISDNTMSNNTMSMKRHLVDNRNKDWLDL